MTPLEILAWIIALLLAGGFVGVMWFLIDMGFKLLRGESV